MFAGGYPMIWDNPHGRPVRGEIFEIDDAILKECDLLEGHPHFYQRHLRQCVTDDGQRHEAWIYVTRRIVDRCANTAPNSHGELEWNDD